MDVVGVICGVMANYFYPMVYMNYNVALLCQCNGSIPSLLAALMPPTLPGVDARCLLVSPFPWLGCHLRSLSDINHPLSLLS